MALSLGRSRVLPRAAVEQMEQHVLAALDRVRSRMRLGGEARLADVMALAPEGAQRELLDGLGKTDPALAKALRAKMLLFEDLARLAPESVRQVVAGVQPAVVATALASATPDVQDVVMASVSKRLRAILEAEAETLTEQRPEDVEGARRSVEQVMRRLHARGALRGRAA
jgi:flagellar motor switch protein FliG